MIDERFWYLLAGRISGEITQEEEQQLTRLLAEHPDYHMVWEAVDSLRSDASVTAGPQTEAKFLAEGWALMRQQLEKQPAFPAAAAQAPDGDPWAAANTYLYRAERRQRWIRAAAVGLILVTGALMLWWNPWGKRSGPLLLKSHLYTTNGSTSTVELPDGSVVHLNGGSRLSYADGFGRGSREVYLKGEAFFEVASDPEHPFRVLTHNMVVRVLGTTFNVRAYREEEKTVTTLISGQIEVELNSRPGKQILLHPHEKLTVEDEPLPRIDRAPTATYEIASVAPDTVVGKPQEIAWMDHKLVFQRESFQEVAYRMEHWFGVHIVFKDATLRKEVLTGAFGRQTLEQALSALQLTTAFRFEIKEDTVYLFR